MHGFGGGAHLLCGARSFPAVIALSLVGLFGQGERTPDSVLRMPAPHPWLDTLRGRRSSSSPNSFGAGLALVPGSARRPVVGLRLRRRFRRAMNRMYEVGEGRPVWKLRPCMLVVTFVLVVLAA